MCHIYKVEEGRGRRKKRDSGFASVAITIFCGQLFFSYKYMYIHGVGAGLAGLAAAGPKIMAN